MTGARQPTGVARLALALASLWLLAAGAGGCADPIVAYHRQFEYWSRVGGEALDEGDPEEARERLLEAKKVARPGQATDLERIETLTLLMRACRELGRLDEAVAEADRAAGILARHRPEDGGSSSGVYGVGAAYLLERGRLEIARGDFSAAEAALGEFLAIRGEDGGDELESARAQLLLAELRRARGLQDDASALFHDSLEQARDAGDRDPVLLGFALFRMADQELAGQAPDRAAELVEEARPDGSVGPALEPGLLLALGRIDAAQGSTERAALRLGDALDRMEADDPTLRRDLAAPERALVLAEQLQPPPVGAAQLRETALRVLAIAEQGSPLRRLQAGRRAVELGGRVAAAGDEGAALDGLAIMAAGRQAIDGATGGRVHDAGVAADFAIARTLAEHGLAEDAAAPCERLSLASDQLSERARAEHPQRLLACGRMALQAGDPKAARATFGRALMIVEDREGPSSALVMELLLRVAAIAHHEGREAEESKLFERVLARVPPGSYDQLEQLLVQAYGPYGRFQPSSAAARLGHAAARTLEFASEASPLQDLAERLGAVGSVPASR